MTTTKTAIRLEDVTTCPKCGSENYGIHSGEPATMSGWYGGQYIGWATVGGPRYGIGGSRQAVITAVRCGDCRFQQAIKS